MGLVWLAAPSVASAAVPDEVGWHVLPGTSIDTVCAAENGFEEVWGVEGCFAILSWSGGILDAQRGRMIVTGGGHNAYYGNELYAFDPEAGTMSRITDPGLPPAAYDPCEEAVAGGTQPNSRHTYDGIEYIEHADRMFVFSGSLACGIGNWGQATWTYDFTAGNWERMDPTTGGDYPTGDAGMTTAYHPGRELVFLQDRGALYSYDLEDNRYTRLSGDDSYATGGYHSVAALDPVREQYVIVGYSSLFDGGRVFAYDVSEDSDYAVQELATVGGEAVVGTTYPGIDYDPVSDRLVAWVGGDSVYTLDLDALQWEEHTFPGGPGPVSESGSGTHGRWRYSRTLGYFLLVNEYDQDSWVLRFQPDAGMPGGDESGSSGDTGSGSEGDAGGTTDTTPPGSSGVDPSGDSGTIGGEPPAPTSSTSAAGDGDADSDAGCGCRGSGRSGGAWLVPLLFALGTRRRRR